MGPPQSLHLSSSCLLYFVLFSSPSVNFVSFVSFIYIYKVGFSLLPTSCWGFLRHMSSMYFFLYFRSFSFRLLQFSQVFSNSELSNNFCTNYYRMKFDNLFYCLLKFKMNKEIHKMIEIYFTYLIYSQLKIT